MINIQNDCKIFKRNIPHVHIKSVSMNGYISMINCVSRYKFDFAVIFFTDGFAIWRGNKTLRLVNNSCVPTIRDNESYALRSQCGCNHVKESCKMVVASLHSSDLRISFTTEICKLFQVKKLFVVCFKADILKISHLLFLHIYSYMAY